MPRPQKDVPGEYKWGEIKNPTKGCSALKDSITEESASYILIMAAEQQYKNKLMDPVHRSPEKSYQKRCIKETESRSFSKLFYRVCILSKPLKQEL